MSYGLRYTEDGVSLATYFCSYISFLNESQHEADVFRSWSRKIVPGPSAAANYFLRETVIKRTRREKGGNARSRRSRDRRAKSDRSDVNSKIVLTTIRTRSSRYCYLNRLSVITVTK